MYKGFSKLLYNQVKVDNTTLPKSVRPIKFAEEIIIILWKFISMNKKFTRGLVQSKNIGKLM